MPAFLFVVLSGVGAHAFDRLSQVSHVQARATRHGLGAFPADLFETVLDRDDVAVQKGRVDGGEYRLDAHAGLLVDVAGAAGGPVGGIVREDPGPWGAGLVVYGLPAPIASLFDPHGLPGRGEQVEQHVGLRPQLVEQVELLGGVVAPVERELPDDVVVTGLDGGLVVLLVRAAPGLLYVPLLQPVDELVVDELRAVVGVEAGDREREARNRLVDGLPDVGLGVVARGDVHGPVRRVVHHGQRPGELAPGARPAVRDGVGLRQARQAGDFVGGLADADRVAQVAPRRAGQRHALGRGGLLERSEPPVDGRRAHRRHLGQCRVGYPRKLPVGVQRGNPLVFVVE